MSNKATYAYRFPTENNLAEPCGQGQFVITKNFKKLLEHHDKTLKKPAHYADLLNVSVKYFSACVRAVTANSVSELIHREVIAESQRLLFTQIQI